MPLKYISLFASAECVAEKLRAAGLDWEPVCFVDVDAVDGQQFANAPVVRNERDCDWFRYRGKVDVVIGCMASRYGARSDASAIFVDVVDAVDPSFAIWESPPAILKSAVFGRFVSELAGCAETLIPPNGNGWTRAGVVAGPRRWIAYHVYYGMPRHRPSLLLVAGRSDAQANPVQMLLKPETLKPSRGGWNHRFASHHRIEGRREGRAARHRTVNHQHH